MNRELLTVDELHGALNDFINAATAEFEANFIWLNDMSDIRGNRGTTDGKSIWINQELKEQNPGKALALALHLAMHAYQWATSEEDKEYFRQPFLENARRGIPVTPTQFAGIYAYEKRAWELGNGYLLDRVLPEDANRFMWERWVQSEFEPDIIELAHKYGAAETATGPFKIGYELENFNLVLSLTPEVPKPRVKFLAVIGPHERPEIISTGQDSSPKPLTPSP